MYPQFRFPTHGWSWSTTLKITSVSLPHPFLLQDAYDALVSNPDPARRRDCLRQFLIILTEQGRLQPLVNFQYEDLQNDVVQILEARARASEVSAASSYYDLLYAFHVHRENYRQVCIHFRCYSFCF